MAVHSLRCLQVVVRKNFVLKGRMRIATLLELILPVALMGLIIWIRTEIHTKQIPERDYVSSDQNNPTWFDAQPRDILHDFGNLGPLAKVLEQLCDSETPSGLCPEIYAKATWMNRKEHYLGVAVDGLLLLHMSLYNQQLGVVGQRSLADFIQALPGYTVADGAGASKSYVRYFEDDAALQDYLGNDRYGFEDDMPQLLGVIVVNSVAAKGSDGTYSGDWDVVIHLNSTGPGSIDINGATDIDTKLSSPTDPLRKDVSLQSTRIYWSGGLFLSNQVPLPTGGFVDLQSLLYAWIYNTTGAFSLPRPENLPKCQCTDVTTHMPTEDFTKCNSALVLLQVLTPWWSTSATGVQGAPFKGCLGRLSGLFPVSLREVPFPTPAYTQDTFAQIVENVFGLFFTLLFLWPLTRIMKSLTDDKEGRINEVMKMMGLPAECITVGWYITYSILWMLPSGAIPLMCWTTVFQHSNKFIIFLFFWLFGVCVISYCSLLAVFFERSRTASVVGALSFFLLYFPYVFVGAATNSFASKALASLGPPVALSFGASLIALLESAGDGVQWGNLDEQINNFTMGWVLTMMVIDSCLFAVLAWYLDKVLVVGFGTRQPLNFLCQRRYWSPDRSGLSAEEAHDLEAAFDDASPGNRRFEPVTPQAALERSVLLRGIKKFFRTQDGQLLAAVQGVTVNLYAGQIFCLLGHNGAGKTTTINMLSGMLPVDEGDAIMYGRSVRKDMSSIRKILGVCPQHDVIWGELTVREHLEFYAAVKDVDPAAVPGEVRNMIADVGLQEKQNSLAGTLSGGQKRRLSAAIALIGGSKVVFLDEPSSGVDPFSRRELWDCLKSKKGGRTLIMTTHFMDEAEELGDRIAIMAAGQIKCVGSSLFLKAQYGVGYTLTITKRAEAAGQQSAALRGLISKACPSAQMLSDVGVELVYRMPMEESRSFPSLFEKFEEEPERLGVQFFSVSVTTLEEVFLRVGQDHAGQTVEERLSVRSFTRQLSGGGTAAAATPSAGEPPSTRARRQAAAAGAPPSSTSGRNPQEAADSMRAPLNAPPSDELLNGKGLFFNHVHALLAKRYHNAKRDKKAWCCQVIAPLLFLVFALVTLRFTGVGSYPMDVLSLASLPGSQTLLFAGAGGQQSDAARAFMQGFGSGAAQAREVENASSAGDFNKYLLGQYYRSDKQMQYAAFRFQYVPNYAMHNEAEEAPHAATNWQVASPRYPGVVTPTSSPEKELWPNGFNVPVGTLWDEADLVPSQPQPVQVPLAALNNRLQVDLFWNATARDGVPIFYHELHNQVLKASLGADKLNGASVKLSNQPFPLTAAQKDLTDAQTSLFLALGFAFIPASYCAFVVLERENNSKHLQIISGVNFVSYWLATWLWDVLNYLVPASLSLALIAAFSVKELVGPGGLVPTTISVLLYGVSCASFTYMLSFLFKSHTSAQNLLLVVYLFTGGILEIVAIVLQIIPSTQDLMRNVLIYIFRLMPNYCLADALTNLITRTTPLVTMTIGCPITGCEPYRLKIIGWDLIFMGVGSVIWFLITLLLELGLATPLVRAWFQGRNIDVEEAADERVDPDVKAEMDRVLSGAADGEMVVLKGLRKVYPGRPGVPPKVAVKGMYFGIPEGQCFGYLGMNGAGKTTTMKILTGEELCTGGEATLGGFDIKTQQNQVRQLIGYCPQFDALIPTLTAREHLMLFARVKGVPKDRIRAYVERMLDQLTLTPYADRQAGTFSGGTKRKLSLGIALVGNPRIVFLDEPTTGVDPESRRFMWTLISTTMQGRSVILTTHSMDECEALCSRIGIMVNGRLVCLGSAAHLKAVHGAGFQFDVAFRQGADLQTSYHRMIAFVKKYFPEGARLMEGAAGGARVKLRLPKGVLPISGLFRAVEAQRGELELAEYSVSETTLDQIFINFAKHQEDADTGVPLARSVSAVDSAGVLATGAGQPPPTR